MGKKLQFYIEFSNIEWEKLQFYIELCNISFFLDYTWPGRRQFNIIKWNLRIYTFLLIEVMVMIQILVHIACK